MFEYCERNIISITSTIGTFLSSKVKWENEDNSLISIEEINNWDRYHIAQRYMNEYFCPKRYNNSYSAIGGIENTDIFIKEVATKIDELIPRCYFRKYCIKNEIFKSNNIRLKEMFISKEDYEFTKDLEYKIIDIDTLMENIEDRENFQINRKSIY